MTARLVGALALGILVGALLVAGGTPVPPAIAFGAGAATITAWRTIPGAFGAFAAMLAAAAMTGGLRGAAPGARSLSPILYPLELYGWLTALLLRHPNGARPSRRLLGAWLASSGTLLLGLSLGGWVPAGAVLVCVALAYRMGALPAFGWAPLLLRHPSNRIAALGIAGMALVGVATLLVVPNLPHADVTHRTLLVLAAMAIPYTAWHAWRQWTRDRRCARSYLAALGASVLLLIM